uniref:Uncharacterized protein n=1 Tax=Hucho hucho TaxID=62062 RepID=A0A4W5QP17_9TELE
MWEHTHPNANPHGAYTHTNPHGHETAAQRYSATRIQAGYEPESSSPPLWSTGLCLCTVYWREEGM